MLFDSLDLAEAEVQVADARLPLRPAQRVHPPCCVDGLATVAREWPGACSAQEDRNG